MNEITKAMIDIRRVLPNLKLASVTGNNCEYGYGEIIFTTHNAVPSFNQACMNINKDKYKNQQTERSGDSLFVKSGGFLFVTFPQTYNLSIIVDSFVIKEIDFEAVNSYQFEHEVKKCTCSKEQVLYKGCVCKGS